MSIQKLKDYDIKNTATQSADNSFVDVDLTLTTNPLTNDFSIRKGNRAVAQAIRNIVLTNPGDLPNEPNFGVGINSILGENYDPISILELKNTIKDQIETYETRVELTDIVTSNPEDHLIRIRVSYVVINNPEEQSVEISVGRVL